MIQLDKYETKWIRLCKGHFTDVYPFRGDWMETLKPVWLETYGWDPDEGNNYRDYLRGLFNVLLRIHMKIKEHPDTEECRQLVELFESVFGFQWPYNEGEPIERGIRWLAGRIQNTRVVNADGSLRFNLD